MLDGGVSRLPQALVVDGGHPRLDCLNCACEKTFDVDLSVHAELSVTLKDLCGTLPPPRRIGGASFENRQGELVLD
jgi:hypothetical protein